MKAYPIAFALSMALALSSYSQAVHVLTQAEARKQFQEVQAHFRTQVLEDLKKSGAPDPGSDTGRPLPDDAESILRDIEPSLPRGHVSDDKPKEYKEGLWAHRMVSQQIETPVGETPSSKRLRVTTVFIKLLTSRAAAVDEMAYILARTEAVLSPGSPSLRPIGQISYFVAPRGGSATILFLRDNAVVEVGRYGPYGIPKDPKRSPPGTRSPSAGSHPDLSGPKISNDRDCDDLALAIDAELTNALGRAGQ